MRPAKHVLISALVIAWPAIAISDPVAKNQDDEVKCPDAVRGVAMTVQQIDGGVTLKFTAAKKEQLTDLRLLLREAATTIEHHSKLLALHPEQLQNNPDAGAIPAVDIDVKDTAMGALVTIHPENPSQLSAVRAQAQGFEQFWAKNNCVQNRAVPTGISSKERKR